MVPTQVIKFDNIGSSNFMSHKLILGTKFLKQVVSVYCETIHCFFILNAPSVLVTFHLIFMR